MANETLYLKTNELLVLSKNFDKWEEFNNDFLKLINFKKQYKVIHKLLTIINNKKTFNSKEIEKFYEKHNQIIDNMKSEKCIYDMLCNNFYQENGINILAPSNFNKFYYYIKENEDKLDKIISGLEKIKELGINHIQFNPNIDFTVNNYSIIKKYNRNWFNIAYLENIVIIPSYYNDSINYKTLGSNYQINYKYDTSKLRNTGIILNSLTFDFNKLPNSSTKEAIFDSIIELDNKEKTAHKNFQNTINLGLNVYELDKNFCNTQSIANQLPNTENREELLKSLSKISEELKVVKKISTSYDENLVNSNPNISKEDISKTRQKVKSSKFYF